MIGKRSRNKSSPKSRSSSRLEVLGCWVAENNDIVAYSQHSNDDKLQKFFKVHREFVDVFFQQIISPAKPASQQSSASSSNLKKNNAYAQSRQSSFTIIYVKKRQYLFHVVYDGSTTLIALSSTQTQIALDEIFDLLYAIKSAFLFFENGQSFVPTLHELHTNYNTKLLLPPKSSSSSSSSSMMPLPVHNGGRTPSSGRRSPPVAADLSGKTDAQLFESIIGDRVVEQADPRDINNSLNANNIGGMIGKIGVRGATDNLCLQAPRFSPHMNGKNYGSINLNIIESSAKGDVFMLKKGFMTKQGNGKFKNWKLRYFELWSNGKLNYFENDDKLRKRGCLNIIDHVQSCDLFNNNIQSQNNYGFELKTNNRNWMFLLDNQIDRDDWVIIIQTILLTKSDMNAKMKNIKMWLTKLDFKWKNSFQNLEFSIDDPQSDKCNIFQLQFDLNAAVQVCYKSKKEISYLRGSDIYASLYNRIESLTENMYGAKCTIDSIIQSRDNTKDGKYNKNGRQSPGKKQRKNSKKPAKKNQSKNKNNNRDNNNNNMRDQSKIAIENRMILQNTIKVRLPGKNGLFRRSGVISKTVQLLDVMIFEKFLKIVISSNNKNTKPLLWLFGSIEAIKEEKFKDIDFAITVVNENGKQLQFVFSDFDESSLWLAALNSLFEQTHCNKHKSMTQVLKIDIPPPPNAPPPSISMPVNMIISK